MTAGFSAPPGGCDVLVCHSFPCATTAVAHVDYRCVEGHERTGLLCVDHKVSAEAGATSSCLECWESGGTPRPMVLLRVGPVMPP